MQERVTFIIKTLERPQCLYRLVKSIFKYYPGAKILIGDDSEISCKAEIEKRYPKEDIHVFELPHDCGVSYGRNYLVQRVKTPFFVLLDDDFEFDENTNIQKGLEMLKKYDVDILGGYFRNYHQINSPFDIIKFIIKFLIGRIPANYNYLGYITYNKNTAEIYFKYYTDRFPEFERADIVHNFFIAKTDVILSRNLWDESLKIHEHTPFFLKAKLNGLRVAFTNCMSVKHKPLRTKKYNTFRNRDFGQEWMKLYKLRKCVFTYNDRKSFTLFTNDDL